MLATLRYVLQERSCYGGVRCGNALHCAAKVRRPLVVLGIVGAKALVCRVLTSQVDDATHCCELAGNSGNLIRHVSA